MEHWALHWQFAVCASCSLRDARPWFLGGCLLPTAYCLLPPGAPYLMRTSRRDCVCSPLDALHV
jgi:hypothetical protein